MKKLIKRTLGAVAVIVGGLVVVFATAQFKFQQSISRSYTTPAPFDSASDGDPKLGQRIVHVRNGCVDCHGADLGGGVVVDDPVAGFIAGANITPYAMGSWSDGEIARAIRYGIKKDNSPLRFMPAVEFHNLSEHDLKSVIAYLRTVPIAQKPNQELRIGPMLKVLHLFGKIPHLIAAENVSHTDSFLTAPAEAPTAEFGRYLAQSACIGCHGGNLKGGPIAGGPPEWPEASDITKSGLGQWTYEQFATTIKTGVNPSGKKLKPPFPIGLLSQLSETESRAMWLYLSSAD